jgi:hypothetical protein
MLPFFDPACGRRRYHSMTNLGDVVRQVEAALCDPRCPPSPHEREVYVRILHQVCTGAVEAKGSR